MKESINFEIGQALDTLDQNPIETVSLKSVRDKLTAPPEVIWLRGLGGAGKSALMRQLHSLGDFESTLIAYARIDEDVSSNGEWGPEQWTDIVMQWLDSLRARVPIWKRFKSHWRGYERSREYDFSTSRVRDRWKWQVPLFLIGAIGLILDALGPNNLIAQWGQYIAGVAIVLILILEGLELNSWARFVVDFTRPIPDRWLYQYLGRPMRLDWNEGTCRERTEYRLGRKHFCYDPENSSRLLAWIINGTVKSLAANSRVALLIDIDSVGEEVLHESNQGSGLVGQVAQRIQEVRNQISDINCGRQVQLIIACKRAGRDADLSIATVVDRAAESGQEININGFTRDEARHYIRNALCSLRDPREPSEETISKILSEFPDDLDTINPLELRLTLEAEFTGAAVNGRSVARVGQNRFSEFHNRIIGHYDLKTQRTLALMAGRRIWTREELQDAIDSLRTQCPTLEFESAAMALERYPVEKYGSCYGLNSQLRWGLIRDYSFVHLRTVDAWNTKSLPGHIEDAFTRVKLGRRTIEQAAMNSGDACDTISALMYCALVPTGGFRLSSELKTSLVGTASRASKHDCRLLTNEIDIAIRLLQCTREFGTELELDNCTSRFLKHYAWNKDVAEADLVLADLMDIQSRISGVAKPPHSAFQLPKGIPNEISDELRTSIEVFSRNAGNPSEADLSNAWESLYDRRRSVANAFGNPESVQHEFVDFACSFAFGSDQSYEFCRKLMQSLSDQWNSLHPMQTLRNSSAGVVKRGIDNQTDRTVILGGIARLDLFIARRMIDMSASSDRPKSIDVSIMQLCGSIAEAVRGLGNANPAVGADIVDRLRLPLDGTFQQFMDWQSLLDRTPQIASAVFVQPLDFHYACTRLNWAFGRLVSMALSPALDQDAKRCVSDVREIVNAIRRISKSAENRSNKGFEDRQWYPNAVAESELVELLINAIECGVHGTSNDAITYLSFAIERAEQLSGRAYSGIFEEGDWNVDSRFAMITLVCDIVESLLGASPEMDELKAYTGGLSRATLRSRKPSYDVYDPDYSNIVTDLIASGREAGLHTVARLDFASLVYRSASLNTANDEAYTSFRDDFRRYIAGAIGRSTGRVPHRTGEAYDTLIETEVESVARNPSPATFLESILQVLSGVDLRVSEEGDREYEHLVGRIARKKGMLGIQCGTSFIPYLKSSEPDGPDYIPTQLSSDFAQDPEKFNEYKGRLTFAIRRRGHLSCIGRGDNFNREFRRMLFPVPRLHRKDDINFTISFASNAIVLMVLSRDWMDPWIYGEPGSTMRDAVKHHLVLRWFYIVERIANGGHRRPLRQAEALVSRLHSDLTVEESEDRDLVYRFRPAQFEIGQVEEFSKNNRLDVEFVASRLNEMGLTKVDSRKLRSSISGIEKALGLHARPRIRFPRQDEALDEILRELSPAQAGRVDDRTRTVSLLADSGA